MITAVALPFHPRIPGKPRILVIQTAFLGDVVLATGVLETLRHHHPEAELGFLLRKGNEAVLEGHPFLSRLWVWNKKRSKFSSLWRIIREIRDWKPDAVVNLHRFFNSGLVTVLSGAGYSTGFRDNPLSFLFTRSFQHVVGKKGDATFPHETDRNHQLLSGWCGGAAGVPRIYPGRETRERIAHLQSGPYVCMAPASVWFTKQWPAANWVALLNQIPDNFRIYLLGGPQDAGLCGHIRDSGGQSRVVSLAGKLSIPESAALMQGATENYVNDSGPLHLASAVGAPVTAIFCSTIPEFGFGPLGSKSRIIETSLTLSCRPCGLHGKKKCPEGHFRCAPETDSGQFWRFGPESG